SPRRKSQNEIETGLRRRTEILAREDERTIYAYGPIRDSKGDDDEHAQYRGDDHSSYDGPSPGIRGEFADEEIGQPLPQRLFRFSPGGESQGYLPAGIELWPRITTTADSPRRKNPWSLSSRRTRTGKRDAR